MRTILITGLALLTLGMFLPAQTASTGKGPTFSSEGCTLRWDEMEQQSEIYFATPKETEHTLTLKGFCTPSAGEDAVAITTKFKPKQALDGSGNHVLRKGKASFSSAKFSAFLPAGAKVELDDAKLTCSPYKLKSISLGGILVVAKARKSMEVPAVVMEDDRMLVPGLKYRITSLRMSTNRELTVQVRYSRTLGGTRGAFLETIHALDPKGNVLGGGRWDKGDPFGKTGTATYTFKLSRAEVHSRFRFTAVTEHVTRIVTFDVKDMFTP
jgi:hypothetical protein